jgi:hypothetical protein
VLDRKVKQRVVKEGLRPYLVDNSQAWEMDADGNYHLRRARGRLPRTAQEQLLAMLSTTLGPQAPAKPPSARRTVITAERDTQPSR